MNSHHETERNMLATWVRSPAARLLSWITSPFAARLCWEPFFWLLGRRAGARQFTLSQAKRVLVIRLDEIGDVVMTTPFLRELRNNLPEAWITLIVKASIKSLVELCPYVDEVLTFDCPMQGQALTLRRHWRSLALAMRSLWRRRFDFAILPRWDVDGYHSTFLAYWSGAVRRIGYSTQVNADKKRVNLGLDTLLTDALVDTAPQHEIQRGLNLLCHFGLTVKRKEPELWVDEQSLDAARQVLAQGGAASLLVALAPGASEASKRWPVERYSQVAQWLAREWQAWIVCVGGPAEVSLGRELNERVGSQFLDVTGKTTLRETAALLKLCQLYIGNDSGPKHIAAAVGTRVIEISRFSRLGSSLHPQSPLRFRAWGPGHVLLQPEEPLSPCTDGCSAATAHCITAVEVEQVQVAVVNQLIGLSHQVMQTTHNQPLRKDGLL
jgi:ADP-heptose:LPS heptosyltransferase